MACGLPVVTTRVGGNAEVVCSAELGAVVPFGDREALRLALQQALHTPWNREHIVAHAAANTWERRVEVLTAEFRGLWRHRPASTPERQRG